METKKRKSTISLVFLFLVLTVFLASGCAVRRLDVTHDTLTKIAIKKQDNILVMRFIDKRKEQNLQLIGKHFGMQEGISLDVLLTKFFSEALVAAGYKAVIQDVSQSTTPDLTKYDAIVMGEITEFWLDFYTARVGHKINVNTKALNPVSHAVVWEKRIEAVQVNMNWVGATGEFEKVISEALTKTLNEAVQAYASDDFSKAIRK